MERRQAGAPVSQTGLRLRESQGASTLPTASIRFISHRLIRSFGLSRFGRPALRPRKHEILAPREGTRGVVGRVPSRGGRILMTLPPADVSVSLSSFGGEGWGGGGGTPGGRAGPFLSPR